MTLPVWSSEERIEKLSRKENVSRYSKARIVKPPQKLKDKSSSRQFTKMREYLRGY
jgi:hypothetical protein